MRFCFNLIGCWMLSAAMLCGAATENPPPRLVSVVRVDARTGRLVRTVMVKPRARAAVASAPDKLVTEAVDAAAKEHSVDPLLVHSVIRAESNYNLLAVSPKGALGLMQLMPATARRFGVSNSYNLTQNIQGGVRYLRYLLDLFQDERLAVAAYNAGEQAVMRYGGVPPYAETQNYVRAVTNQYAAAKESAAGEAAPGARASIKVEPEFRPAEQFIDAEGNLYVRTR